MTSEEAKTVLINSTTFIKDGFRFMKEEHQEQFKEAYRVALQALEKQIPKKPQYEYSEEDYWHTTTVYGVCSVCGKRVEKNRAYCQCCGQALDWSE